MDDDKPDPPEPDAPEAPEATDEPFDPERAKSKIAKANNEAANLRKRLKELEPLAARAKELEEAGKSEAERLTERVTAAETRAQEAESRALRAEVAAAKGLTAAQAKRLMGSTQEELEADADELLESFAGDGKKAPATRPTERLRGGNDPTEDAQEMNPAKLAALVPRPSY